MTPGVRAVCLAVRTAHVYPGGVTVRRMKGQAYKGTFRYEVSAPGREPLTVDARYADEAARFAVATWARWDAARQERERREARRRGQSWPELVAVMWAVVLKVSRKPLQGRDAAAGPAPGERAASTRRQGDGGERG